MLFFIIGMILIGCAGWITTRDNNDPVAWLAFLALFFIGGYFVCEDVYFDVIVRGNIADFNNGGAGLTYTNSGNSTTIFYSINDPLVGEYFARNKAERENIALLATSLPYLVGLIVLYLFYYQYKRSLEGIAGKR